MRKFISVLLALMLVFSLTTVAFNAYNVVDEGAIDTEEATADVDPVAKVYFQMPNGENGPIATKDVYVHHPAVLDPETGDEIQEEYDELVIGEGDHALSWYNDFNLAEDGKHYAGMYWWDAPASPTAWPGYRMGIDDYDNSIFYAYVPGDGELTSGIFNNGVDGGTDDTQPIYFEAAQTVDNNMEGAYVGDYDTLWEDTYNEFDFDGCIFIVDPDQVSINAYSGKQTCGGNWYFYYGNGCYGNVRTDSDDFVSAEDNCVNPDHHHGEEPQPTEAEPTEAQPTEAEPTEAQPTEAEPTEAEPTEAEPTEAQPTEAQPTEAQPTEAQPTEAEEDTITVYFTNGESWDNVSAYYWGSDADPTWPGSALEVDHQNEFGQDVYKAVLPKNVKGLIFNNGNNGEQTANIESGIEDGAEFYTTGEKDDDGHAIVKKVGGEDEPTEEPKIWDKGYYLTGTVANWGLQEGMMLTDEGDGLYSYGPISLTTNDMIKVIDVNKKGTGIGNWYPDGMDNNRTVPADGEYTIYFRPAGDGTAEDGWEYIPYEGDESGEDAHGCKNGGYMFKFVGSSTEPTEAEPTEAQPTEAEPTEAQPTEAEPTEPAPAEYKVYAVGNGVGAWLNGISWNPGAEANLMTEGTKDVWTFNGSFDENVPATAEFKFAIDGTWDFNFGIDGDATVENGVEMDAVKGGENIKIPALTAASTVTAVLDLSNYDAETETGAKVTVSWTGGEQPVVWDKGYYVTGTVADWGLKEGMMMTDEGDGLYSYGPITLTTDDMIKVIDVNKKGTAIGNWYPDGMDNNQQVAEDGDYMIYFRPAGDGTEEDGWNYIYYVGDGSDDSLNHGCTRGGYMFKFVKEEDKPEPDYILGDVDGNGVVDSVDATLVQRYDAQMTVPPTFNEAAADVDGDGEITIVDVTLIQRYVVKMKVKFPIGEGQYYDS
ncbi:MAG: starch-binding protein [Ruminococcus sp.]|nr:starch-binding protein [Ruminococcus sp.]